MNNVPLTKGLAAILVDDSIGTEHEDYYFDFQNHIICYTWYYFN